MNSYDVPNKINIEQNERGITYCRNYMLDFARRNDIQFFACCDDDINQFGRVKDGRAVRGVNADDLIQPFVLFKKSGAALAGINLRQFAWSEKKSIRVNAGKVVTCAFLNMGLISWRYREDTKEDLDFTMQCLNNRQNFLFFAKTFFNAPAIGTNSGGLHSSYIANVDARWALAMQRDWPEYVKIITQYGRTDVRVDYKKKAQDMGLVVK